jgi:hypothetical protein
VKISRVLIKNIAFDIKNIAKTLNPYILKKNRIIFFLKWEVLGVVVESKSSFRKKKIMTNNLATSIELKTTGIDKASIPKQATH